MILEKKKINLKQLHEESNFAILLQYETCTYIADLKHCKGNAIFGLCKVQFENTLFRMVQGERRKRI